MVEQNDFSYESQQYKQLFNATRKNIHVLLPSIRRHYLFGELLFTQLVEGVELSGQRDVLQEAARGQLDADDDLTVRHHHGHITELDFQVLRQLLTTMVAQVLRKNKC